MNNFKKWFQKGIALFMAVALCMTTLTTNAAAASKNFEFTYSNVTVSIDSPAATLIEKAGKANKTTKTMNISKADVPKKLFLVKIFPKLTPTKIAKIALKKVIKIIFHQ